MPVTPVYGFSFEDADDQPGHSLTGGAAGLEPILAEQVETELVRIDTDVVDLQARLALLEAGTSMVGWVPIALSRQAEGAVSSFDIDLTDGGRFAVGEFELVRLNMRFDLSAEGTVACQINGDDGGGTAYSDAQRGTDAANPSGDFNAFPITTAGLGVDRLTADDAGNYWRIGWGAGVSTNNLVCTFFDMSGNFSHSFQSVSTRQSTSATTTLWTKSWGALNSALTAAPSSLHLLSGTPGVTYVDAWWWAEGYRLPS